MHKIIILENEPLLMRALTRALDCLNLEIFTGATLREASAQLIDHADICVLVTDYYLDAQTTSLELLRWCARERPDCRRVVISGRERAALAIPPHACDAFLAKPFSIQDFRDLVRQQLDAHQHCCHG